VVCDAFYWAGARRSVGRETVNDEVDFNSPVMKFKGGRGGGAVLNWWGR
jgi:hypothetical protein